SITPVAVTHELCGAFAADAISRVADGNTIGALALVPAAGLTHAASGIGEARLAGIPMIVLTGGIRRDMPRRYQLHDIDQLALAKELTKGAYRVLRTQDVVPTIFEAAHLALNGEPGPVLVELPLDVLLFSGDIGALPTWTAPTPTSFAEPEAIARAAEMLSAAQHPGIFVGWGGRAAADALARTAELLGAPVATTLQGLASFSHDHRLHAGFSFGRSAVPAARNAFAHCDCLLAVGTRFAEIATGSYGVRVPTQLVHVDINPAVFDANYPAAVSLHGDAKLVVQRLLQQIESRPSKDAAARAHRLAVQIAADKARYQALWLAHDSGGRVNPARFFGELRSRLPDSTIVVVDDGNHTYLTAELLPIYAGGKLIVPTDFNAMGYAVPAAIGAQLVHPDRQTIAIVGDAGFLMTCMEIVTAVRLQLGIIYFIFHDGESAQIAQAQRLLYRRAPCTQVGEIDHQALAAATGAAWVPIGSDAQSSAAISEALRLAAQGRPVIVPIAIDYSKLTAFTEGTVSTNFRRFSLMQKARILGRIARRTLTDASARTASQAKPRKSAKI
ncbi:MAG TPA: thiamine pyrophosphate-binding protein, partial [Burkholderiaceae bacterium]|nr:thiamine pyrophosphate-binding protein [Burkholderiaceae bacterium]